MWSPKAFPFRGRWPSAARSEEVVPPAVSSVCALSPRRPTSSDPALRPAHLPLNRSLRSLGKALTTAIPIPYSLFPIPYCLRIISTTQNSHATEQLPILKTGLHFPPGYAIIHGEKGAVYRVPSASDRHSPKGFGNSRMPKPMLSPC